MPEDKPLAARFSEEKAAIAAALLIHWTGERSAINYMKLLKLIYLFDRAAIVEWGHPVIGGRYFSLDFGPVPVDCYDLVLKGPKRSTGPWTKTVSLPSGYDVRRLDMPESDLLSDAEIELLEKVAAEFGRFTEFELSKMLHDPRYFPEWEDPHGSSIPIQWEDILRSQGKSRHEIDRVRRDALEMERLDSIFEG